MIFKLKMVQENKVRLYTLGESLKELRLMRQNGTRKAVYDFRTTRQLEDSKE